MDQDLMKKLLDYLHKQMTINWNYSRKQKDKKNKHKKERMVSPESVSQPNWPHPLIAVGSSTIRRAENQQTEPDIRLVDMLNLNMKMVSVYFLFV